MNTDCRLTTEELVLLRSLSDLEQEQFLAELSEECQAIVREQLQQAKPITVKTIDELASHLKRSSRRVATYLAQGLRAARHTPDGYDVGKAVEWVSRHVEEKGSNRKLDHQKKAAEVRKANADASAKELRNLVAEGKLVNFDDVQQWASEIANKIRMRLEDMADEFEMEFPADIRAELKDRMDRYCRLVTKELHDSITGKIE